MSNTKVVTVTFNETDRYHSSYGKEYSYLTDLDFEPGDLAVVHVTGRADSGYKLVTVQSIKESGDSKATKWIVDKVDTSKEQERILRAQRQAEADKILASARSKVDKRALYLQVQHDLTEEERKIVQEAYGF